ncbi:unnamed protein product [Meganyctiphanes norvegica]|uniref:SAM-dependent MTase TRM10-type domain-containing protein n=2 Tax=Meganyctiphanes norvegica TaxID=48144 RepID=A0AAV2R2Z6_MEGNR
MEGLNICVENNNSTPEVYPPEPEGVIAEQPVDMRKVKDEKELDSGIDILQTENVTKLSKNQMRKQRRHMAILAIRKEKRKDEKLKRKENKGILNKTDLLYGDTNKLSKKEIKEKIKKKLIQAQNISSVKICVDLQYGNIMSDKEKTRLALQLGRIYGSNRASENPAHLYFINLSENSDIFKKACEKCEGFDHYIVERSHQSAIELFPQGNIVYLSPDSPNVLKEVNKSNVYIIGGLVDETVNKHQSLTYATNVSIKTARLPIKEFLEKSNNDSHTFSTVLSVNQVFDILLSFLQCKDWKQALQKHVPQRKGFV